MRENPRLLKSAILIIFFLAIFVGSLIVLKVRDNALKAQSVLGEMDMSVIPYIVSVPPVTAIEGEEYTYEVKFSDRDSKASDISISLVDSPNWMNVSGMIISGIPPVGSSGQYKFTVKITDGVNSSIQENYILVQSNVE